MAGCLNRCVLRRQRGGEASAHISSLNHPSYLPGFHICGRPPRAPHSSRRGTEGNCCVKRVGGAVEARRSQIQLRLSIDRFTAPISKARFSAVAKSEVPERPSDVAQAHRPCFGRREGTEEGIESQLWLENVSVARLCLLCYVCPDTPPTTPTPSDRPLPGNVRSGKCVCGNMYQWSVDIPPQLWFLLS